MLALVEMGFENFMIGYVENYFREENCVISLRLLTEKSECFRIMFNTVLSFVFQIS